ncbi:hypothetical protein ACH5BF_05325 [Arcobacter sp. YIC-464]|uniref:hypothetical protein n=1 Tax=Arcobacter sp. YIC-464 TaxID=3376631 RepID=UPI003C13E06B
MKSPKGFGKSYFTFSSILAHSVQNIIESQTTIAKKTLRYSSSKNVDCLEDEDPPELLISIAEITTNSKPCHCDCHFRKKTKLAISLFKFIPRCPYYTTYFAFRRSGVHPPLLLS